MLADGPLDLSSMNRRTFLKGALMAGGVAAAGAGGFALWGSRGEQAWAAAGGELRRPFDPKSGTRELVRAAVLAANSHNTQPWRFAVAERSIAIRPDFARRTPAVDPDDHHLFVSLGCAAENIVQAAPAMSFSAAVAVESGEAGGVTVDLAPTQASATPMAQAILARQCTRSAYDGREVPAADLAALVEAARGDGVEPVLVVGRQPLEKALEFLIEGNTKQIGDPAFVAELKQWLRFSYGHALNSADGLFAKCSGNPALPGPIGPLMFGLVFTADAENRKLAQQVRSSAGLIVFASEKNDRRHWVAAGRAYQRFALRATMLGVRHAFVNQPVEVADVRPRFAAHLGLGEKRPDLVVRFGYAPAMPMSVRRPVEAVIS